LLKLRDPAGHCSTTVTFEETRLLQIDAISGCLSFQTVFAFAEHPKQHLVSALLESPYKPFPLLQAMGSITRSVWRKGARG
jgi:hypothetical protein